jgi:outer membrane receptor protein involved in Fe transport
VAGVQASPGGDTGPAGAVTSFWGLHEFDAFLLVVDGVPWGGAFNPAIPSLDLQNVERIEVLRGAAPVTFGATSFVGVIQVLHYAAGAAPNEVGLSFGSHGSLQSSVSLSFAPVGGVQQSMSLAVERKKFSAEREAVESGRLKVRSGGPLAGGTFKLDLDIGLQRQVPAQPRGAGRRKPDHLGLTGPQFEPDGCPDPRGPLRSRRRLRARFGFGSLDVNALACAFERERHPRIPSAHLAG